MSNDSTNTQDLVWPQGIYKRHEIPVADYLMSLREKLAEEFLIGFNSLKEVKLNPFSLININDG